MLHFRCLASFCLQGSASGYLRLHFCKVAKNSAGNTKHKNTSKCKAAFSNNYKVFILNLYLNTSL